MQEYLIYFVLVFTSFFSLMNPLGVMPVFMTMTANLDKKDRQRTVVKAVIVAFATLIGFALTGQVFFKFFGISVESFRIVGGVIFFMVGYDMLQARLSPSKVTKAELDNYVNDISITPLAIPMICGPGAITNAIVLMEDSPDFTHKVILFAAILVMAVVTLVILSSAGRITESLGDTGNKILMRLMGLIVMVIAVEFFFSGLEPILQRIFHITA